MGSQEQVEGAAMQLRRQLSALGDEARSRSDHDDPAVDDRAESPAVVLNPEAVKIVDQLLALIDGRPVEAAVVGLTAESAQARIDSIPCAEVVLGDGSRRTLNVGDEIIIGRGRPGPGRVALADLEVSRNHLRLSFGSQLLAEDLGSTNGTSVERAEAVIPVPAGDALPLQQGDRVVVGSMCVVEVLELRT